MPKVLIIGAGGVGAVVAHKCAQVPEVFTDIVIASRTKSRVDALAKQLPRKVTTALKAYALLATSADKGAVRDRQLLDGV